MFKRKGRPTASEKTIQKTYMFFESDIEKSKKAGYSPKAVFRFGLQFFEKTPQYLHQIEELRKGNDKLQKQITSLSVALSKRSEKQWKQNI